MLLWRYEIFHMIGWPGLQWTRTELFSLWPISFFASISYLSSLLKNKPIFQGQLLLRISLWLLCSTYLLHWTLLSVENLIGAIAYEGYTHFPLAIYSPPPWYLSPLFFLIAAWLIFPAAYLCLAILIGGTVTYKQYLALVVSIPFGLGLGWLTTFLWPTPYSHTDPVHVVKAGYGIFWVMLCFSYGPIFANRRRIRVEHLPR